MGAVRKSNRTDNASAKTATSKGVIRGYTGIAAVDAAHQIIVVAQAHGTRSELELLVPIVEALQPLRGATTLITVAAGYQSEANFRVLDAMSVNAPIADRDLRQRDERFATQGRHQQAPHPLHNKTATPTTPTVFTPTDFTYDAVARTCVCPAGKSLYRRGGHRKTNSHRGAHFRGAKRASTPRRDAHHPTNLSGPFRNPTREHGRHLSLTQRTAVLNPSSQRRDDRTRGGAGRTLECALLRNPARSVRRAHPHHHRRAFAQERLLTMSPDKVSPIFPTVQHGIRPAVDPHPGESNPDAPP